MAWKRWSGGEEKKPEEDLEDKVKKTEDIKLPKGWGLESTYYVLEKDYNERTATVMLGIHHREEGNYYSVSYNVARHVKDNILYTSYGPFDYGDIGQAKEHAEQIMQDLDSKFEIQ